MTRTAEDLLEFDKLRELLRLRTTCAPGRRAVNGLEPGMERAALESAFALIREAREWLRAGRELGFAALADPQDWLERIEGPGMALEPGEFLDAASLLLYTRPAVSVLHRRGIDPASFARWRWTDVAHALVLLAGTAGLLALVFARQEKRWLENA